MPLAPAHAQPPLNYPAKDFYGALGRRVTVEATANPTALPADGELTFTLTVHGATNPHRVARPDLRTLPDFAAAFQVADVPGPPADEGAKEVRFAYQLRPRSAAVTAVPPITFAYVNPNLTDGPHPSARTKPIPLTITAAAPKAEAAPTPLAAPDWLFQLPSGPLVGRGPFDPDPGTWVGIAVGGPVLAAGWFLLWRWRFPDAARRVREMRSKAARRALDALRRAPKQPDPAGAVAAAVRTYLATRFALPPGAVTPADLAAALTAAGVGAEHVRGVENQLRACDAARFAPAAVPPPTLAAHAENLISTLEATA